MREQMKACKKKHLKQLEDKAEDLKVTLRPYIPHRTQAEAPCKRSAWKQILRPHAESHLLKRRQVYQAWRKEIEDAKPDSDPTKVEVKISSNLYFVDTLIVPGGEIPTPKKRHVAIARVYAKNDWPCFEQVSGCFKGWMKFLQLNVESSAKMLLSLQTLQG